MQACSELGCPVLVERGKCAKHRARARRDSDQRRPNAHARGYDRRWQRTRKRYLRAHPGCEQEGCGREATDVHHLDGLGPSGPHGHDQANLMALCHEHHSQVTSREQRGGWHAA